MNPTSVFLLGRGGINWSIDADRRNTYRILSRLEKVEVVKNILQADVVHCIWYNKLLSWKARLIINILKLTRSVSVSAVITNDAYYNQEKIEKLRDLVDVWIAPSTKCATILEKKNLTHECIPFYVRSGIFKEQEVEAADLFELSEEELNKKILIGSFQRDTLGDDLSQPKWQKDPELFVEIVRRFPPSQVLVILAGPRRHYIINRLKECGIPYLYIGNEELVEEGVDDIRKNNIPKSLISKLYNVIDVYLVTSKSEGGPKGILEASLCNTPVVSPDVGIASDVLDDKLIFNRDNPGDAVDIINKAVGCHGQGLDIQANKNRAVILMDKNAIRKKYENVFLGC